MQSHHRDRAFIIAEAGSCHDGSLDKALALIDAAADAGADAVKFQFWSSTDRMVARRNAPAYRDIYEQYRTPIGWLPSLWTYAKAKAIEFMCSTYLPEDVSVVAPYVARFKIASFEANDSELLGAHRDVVVASPVLVSLGMDASFDMVQSALPYRDVRGLWCVSAYPTPRSAARLATIRERGLDGYSDHSEPTDTMSGAIAYANGANIIERHFRLTCTGAENPDNATAMSPAGLCLYIRRIRLAEELTCGGGHDVEGPMRGYRVRL